MKTMFIVLLLAIVLFLNEVIFSQSCPDCICGTEGSGYQDPDSLIGGRFKPVRTDIGGATQGEDNFPVLIVFVQFSDEPYSYSTDPGAWNSGQPPNYMDSLISEERLSSSSWWNSYNGFAISDYWHEFSRGKLHVYGNKLSIILPQEIGWYETPGRGIAKVNKDIYETIKPLIQIWSNYDRWKYVNDGEFSWEKDGLIDMMYIVYRSRRDFLFDRNSGRNIKLSGFFF